MVLNTGKAPVARREDGGLVGGAFLAQPLPRVVPQASAVSSEPGSEGGDGDDEGDHEKEGHGS